MLSLEEIFPPYALRIACGPVELRMLRDEDLPELVEVVRGGIFDPALPMPFLHAWNDEPWGPGLPGHFPATSLTWWFSQRGMITPENWRLALVVRRDGAVVGMQDVGAKGFPQTRSVTTGSWLGRAHHGQGTGTLMRQMAVGFCFDHLGALELLSAYIDGNHASAAVSRKTGYVENGSQRILSDGKGVVERMVRITPETFNRPEQPIEVSGAAELRRFLGIEA